MEHYENISQFSKTRKSSFYKFVYETFKSVYTKKIIKMWV